MNIRDEIKKLVKQIGRIRDRAVMQKRDLTLSEADRLDDLLNEIDGLEQVDVCYHDREWNLVSARTSEFSRQRFIEMAPIREAGQAVGSREAFQFVILLDQFALRLHEL